MLRDIRQIDQLKEVAARVADRLMGHEWKVWFWGDSIGLEGLLDTSEFVGDKKYEAFVYGLIKGWVARRDPHRIWDYTAPGVALLRLYERTADPALLRAAQAHAEYLAGFRQTDHGAYVRYEDADFDLPPEMPEGQSERKIPQGPRVSASKGGPCVFVDNMHFDGPFFAKLYRVTGNDRYRQLAVGNILPQIKLFWNTYLRTILLGRTS
jgi:unsaturated rhamnogalacturonyl hydrolase